MTEPMYTVQTKPCFGCGQVSLIELPAAGCEAYHKGALVQVAFPALSAEEREMVVSGTHPACWTAMMGEEE